MLLSVLFSNTLVYGAETSTSTKSPSNTKILSIDLSNEALVNRKVAEAFEDENISHVQVIDPTLMEETLFQEEGNLRNFSFHPLAAYGFLYRPANAKKASDYIDKDIIAKASGKPGVVIQISQTKKISCTFSASGGVSSKQVTALVGFDVTSENAISISGSYKIPLKKKKKKGQKGLLGGKNYL